MEHGKKLEVSFCRKCGGDRDHIVICEKSSYWAEQDTPIDGGDTWAMLECAGCHSVTFLHRHWFSEDYEMRDDGPAPIMHIDLYPPAPRRKKPEWGPTAFLGLKPAEFWLVHLHADIYQALGLKAYALATMGIRAIVDFIVTSNGGDKGSFKDKLERMHEKSLITKTQIDVIYAAFDAGSAAAHRGYIPEEDDVYTLLDITEQLFQQLYVTPAQHEIQARAAVALKAKTPQRQKH